MLKIWAFENTYNLKYNLPLIIQEIIILLISKKGIVKKKAQLISCKFHKQCKLGISAKLFFSRHIERIVRTEANFLMKHLYQTIPLIFSKSFNWHWKFWFCYLIFWYDSHKNKIPVIAKILLLTKEQMS